MCSVTTPTLLCYSSEYLTYVLTTRTLLCNAA